MLQPFAQPRRPTRVRSRYQTRALEAELAVVSAPTGQMSTTFAEYGLSSVLLGASVDLGVVAALVDAELARVR